MALGSPGGHVTQPFGPSILAVEPDAWVSRRDRMTRRAYWQPFPGAVYQRHMHMGVDFGGLDVGRALLALEAGKVTRSEFDRFNGGGNVVEVEIRPDVRYSLNHLDARKVKVGAVVRRGQIIGTMGCTGTLWTGKVFIPSCLGAHVHVNLTIRERLSDGIRRTMLYDVSDFMAGGEREDDPRIRPR